MGDFIFFWATYTWLYVSVGDKALKEKNSIEIFEFISIIFTPRDKSFHPLIIAEVLTFVRNWTGCLYILMFSDYIWIIKGTFFFSTLWNRFIRICVNIYLFGYYVFSYHNVV